MRKVCIVLEITVRSMYLDVKQKKIPYINNFSNLFSEYKANVLRKLYVSSEVVQVRIIMHFVYERRSLHTFKYIHRDTGDYSLQTL